MQKMWLKFIAKLILVLKQSVLTERIEAQDKLFDISENF